MQKPLTKFRATHLLVHYAELALKGKNRDWFEARLVRNLRNALEGDGEPGATVKRLFGRILLELPPGAAWETIARKAAGVFGVAYVMPAVIVEPTLEALAAAAVSCVAGETEARTFGVQARRSTKDFPFSSMEVQVRVGAAVQQATGWKVHLDAPELPVRVELLNRSAYLGFGRLDGWGGLPTGVAGRLAFLLSGGIDSPVAAHRMLRRGATAAYVHCHSHPHTGLESQAKVRELATRIQPVGSRARLHLVPLAELQRRVVTECPQPLRVVIYRRFMVRVAEAIARKEGALGIVTGESLGQVASQTLENLRTIDCVATLPVLRPLIGMDKEEIIEEARRIGTFETSIEPHGDCCSFLMPKNPATSTTPEQLAEAEKAFDVPAEVEALLASAVVEEIGRRPAPSQSGA